MPIVPSNRPGRRILPLALLLLLAAAAAGASEVTATGPEPLRPSTRSFFSANGEYRVKIKPQDMLPARAVVARRQASGRFEPVARFHLLAPVSTAAVTDDGAFLLTLPPSSVLGPDELAVYEIGPPGRSFVVPGLRGLLFDATLRDAAPIHDEARGHLVFGLPRWDAFDCRELALDLATGRPLTAPEDVFPKPRVEIVHVPAPPTPEPPAATVAAALCGQDATEPSGMELVQLSGEELLASARERLLPYFTEVAKKARYTVDVTADLVVSEHGRTMCVRTSQAHFGLDRAAAEALRKWVFEPPYRDGRPVRAVGTVVVRFEMAGGVRCRERGEEDIPAKGPPRSPSLVEP